VTSERLRRTLVVLVVAAGAGALPRAQQPPQPSLGSIPRATPAQQPPSSASAASRAAERITALQQEADALARQEKTLIVELRRLEVERDLRVEQARRADAQVAAVARQMAATTVKIREAEAAIEAARPALEARLVETYKLGRPGYARMVLGVEKLTDAARAARMVAALAQIDQHRVADFNAAIARLEAAQAALGRQAGELKVLQASARQASAQAERAAAARAQLVRDIDGRRDLNAQLVAELEAIRDRLTRTVAGFAATTADDPTLLPLRAFRGAVEWPVPGRLASRFGEQHNPKFGTKTIQNGIEIEARDGSPVQAVHEGRVAFAGPFTGFGQLVIVDHGTLAYSLYGYLSSIAVIKGQRVGRGQALGASGHSPTGNSSLYFELRIDAKPVDPLQWLKAKQ
jgi:murein hydrolase activator